MIKRRTNCFHLLPKSEVWHILPSDENETVHGDGDEIWGMAQKVGHSVRDTAVCLMVGRG